MSDGERGGGGVETEGWLLTTKYGIIDHAGLNEERPEIDDAVWFPVVSAEKANEKIKSLESENSRLRGELGEAKLFPEEIEAIQYAYDNAFCWSARVVGALKAVLNRYATRPTPEPMP